MPETFHGVIQSEKMNMWDFFFFFFLRAGEFTTSNEVSEVVLTPQDVSVDSHEYPKHLIVQLRSSKTEIWGWFHATFGWNSQ